MPKHLFSTCVSILAISVFGPQALAQATLDRVLSTVSVTGNENCSTVDVRFNRAAGYRHHSPRSGGQSVDVTIEILGTSQTEADQELGDTPQREAASVPSGNPAGLDSVVLIPQAGREAVVQISFTRAVKYRVVMDTNSRHLRLDVASMAGARSCLGAAAGGDEGSPESNEASKSDGVPGARDPSAALKEGKKLLAAKEYPRAIALFTKAIDTGKGDTRREAMEMLGLARERSNQLAHAKAVYEDYLKTYPSAEGASRVKDRLAGVLAAMDESAQGQLDALRSKRAPEAVPDLKTNNIGEEDLAAAPGKGDPGGEEPGLRASGSGMVIRREGKAADPNAWTWDKSGSVAEYYYRNDSLRASDPLKQNYGLHEVFQNELLSTADGYLHGENQHYEVELRASLFNEKGFGQQSDINTTSVGALYAEGRMKDNGLSAKVGRQSKSTGGVFGRFDGAVLGWDLGNDVKIEAYGGSPVYRRDAMPFEDQRYFYGMSLDYTLPGDKWAGGIYAIGQEVESIIDRRAIGAELRYNDQALTAYAAGDFDIFYKELNNAYLNANWRVRDGTTIYGTVDFRRVPFLVTSNALMGQTEDDLQSLVDVFGLEDVYQLALDRTATAKTASLGISQEITDNWQVSLDAMVADYSGTPASGGVDAIPDPGVEFYGSVQLSGTDVFDQGDSLNLGLRYSTSDSSNFYMADAYYRYMLSENWRLSPRLRVSLRDSKTSDQMQYVVSGSLASRYKLDRHWSFETELGARWEDIATSASDTRSIDILATAGFRYEF